MTLLEKLALVENRLANLRQSPKNIKCPGVCRKLTRQVRNLRAQCGLN